jgi:hypothetical protein
LCLPTTRLSWRPGKQTDLYGRRLFVCGFRPLTPHEHEAMHGLEAGNFRRRAVECLDELGQEVVVYLADS